jgi:hypothetical protein
MNQLNFSNFSKSISREGSFKFPEMSKERRWSISNSKSPG